MPMQRNARLFLSAAALLALAALVVMPAAAADWTHWRGPNQNGVSLDKDLVDSWSKDGANLIWRDDFTGRSTPIVVDGRVCAIGRAGTGITRQEAVACWSAENGRKLWERRFNVYHTTVPFNRVGWASMAADRETGYLYAQGVDGRFVAFDAKGNTVWEWLLGQDLGRMSGYGGRTNTPLVDEDRVIAHIINAGWGKDFGPLGDRFIAFDKKTGEILWVSERGGTMLDVNTYSTPVVGEVGGQRLIVGGGGDGAVRAVQSRTGKTVWTFQLSQRGLNSSPVFDGDTVYIGQSEENVDEGTMGRFVAIDATGTGDVTKTHERWRANELAIGYASPLLHDGTLYLADNSANLIALDAKTGAKKWETNYGTVGKGSPVWVDGKIFITEVNGHLVILKPGPDGAEELDREFLKMPHEDRYAEVYASPAIAYGRMYFVTEEGVYCVGDPERPFKAVPGEDIKLDEKAAPADAEPAWLQVVPAVVVAKANDTVDFRARLYDAKGRFLRETAAEWSVAGKAPASIDAASGKLTFDAKTLSLTHTTSVTAKAAGLSGKADIRVAGELPWSEDFEGYEANQRPDGWLGIGPKGEIQDLDGNKVLMLHKPTSGGAPRAFPNIGPSYLAGYTMQADVMGLKKGRQRSDVGIFNSGYVLDMQGSYQRLRIYSWASELRMMQEMDFAWDPDIWYTMKMRVDDEAGGKKAVIRAKVWKKGEDEPADWTFVVEDPLPILSGSPGLYAFTPVDAYFDNVKVEVSK